MSEEALKKRVEKTVKDPWVQLALQFLRTKWGDSFEKDMRGLETSPEEWRQWEAGDFSRSRPRTWVRVLVFIGRKRPDLLKLLDDFRQGSKR